MHGWARSAGRTVASATQQHKRVVVARWAHQRLEGIDGAESVARQAEPAQVQQAGILKCLERAVDEEDGCEARVERAERLRRPARGAAARTRRDLEADEHAQRAGESKLHRAAHLRGGGNWLQEWCQPQRVGACDRASRARG